MTTYWFKDPMVASFAPVVQATALRGLGKKIFMPRLFIGDRFISTAPLLAPGPWDELAARCTKRKAFIVTDEGAARFAQKVAEVLQSRQFTTMIWDRALPEVPVEILKDGVEEINRFEPDVIVGVGGGSGMDTSKAIFSLYERPDIPDPGTISPFMALNLRKKALLVEVPTTSGTGSECSAGLVISDTDAHRKIPIMNPEFIPDYAVLIPSFTIGVPPRLTAGTGLDTLAHAVDCAVSPMVNDFSLPLALKAIELTFRWLPAAFKDGANLEARSRMQVAASLAGIAFTNGGLALTHGLGHSVGHLFNLHHGVAVGVFIPYALQYYAPVSDKYLEICDTLKVKGKTRAARLAGLVAKVRDLFKELEIPSDLKSMGIDKAEFNSNMEKLVLYALEDPSCFQSPRSITGQQCELLFRCAYEGRDVDF
jgi:hypothetical protein